MGANLILPSAVPSVPKLLHYSTLVLEIHFGRRNVNITSPKLSWNYFLGAVIFAGNLNDFCPVISGDWGLWENLFLAP